MNLTLQQQEIIAGAKVIFRYSEPCLTIEELAAFLSISVSSVQRLRAHGCGPWRIKESYRHMYKISDVMKWLEHSAVAELTQMNFRCSKKLMAQIAQPNSVSASQGAVQIAAGHPTT